MSQATLFNGSDVVAQTVPAAGYAAGSVLQLPDGRVAVVAGLKSLTLGEEAGLKPDNQFTVTKMSGKVILRGGRVFWDRISNSATPIRTANCFVIGVAVYDAASTDTTVVVALNEEQDCVICLCDDEDGGEWDSTLVKTAGAPLLTMLGMTAKLSLDSTNEAQKVDLLSVKSVPVTVPMILEARIGFYDYGNNGALDVNIGLANGTHASDADSITEAVLLHLDGNALDLYAESRDGTTTVAATDTTLNAVASTYFELWIDARDLTSVKIYLDGVRVLSGSTFKLDKATGPLKALAHVEKSSNATTADVRIGRLCVRAMDVL